MGISSPLPAAPAASPFATKAAAAEVHGGLSSPSKMPGTSYGIPAQACRVGHALHGVPGTVCESCYALKNAYNFPDSKVAYARRLASLQDPLWVEAMVRALRATPQDKGQRFHRWHDSGDLQGLWHLQNIVAVAAATPHVQHWLPTREYGIVSAFVAQGGVFPENLCVRLSDAFIDEQGSKAERLALRLNVTSSGVHSTPQEGARVCPAPQQGGKCGDCRSCWRRDVPRVSYHIH